MVICGEVPRRVGFTLGQRPVVYPPKPDLWFNKTFDQDPKLMTYHNRFVCFLGLIVTLCPTLYAGTVPPPGGLPLAEKFLSTGIVQFKDIAAREYALAIGGRHPRTTINVIKGTDLLRFKCYGATPAEAKTNAERLVKKLRDEEARRVASDNGMDVKDVKKDTNKHYIFHDLPILPKKPVTENGIEQDAASDGL